MIGIPNEKWGERPLLVIVPSKDGQPTQEGILEFLGTQVVRWWLPDDVVFVEQLPVGGTGKVQKMKLRELYPEGRGESAGAR